MAKVTRSDLAEAPRDPTCAQQVDGVLLWLRAHVRLVHVVRQLRLHDLHNLAVLQRSRGRGWCGRTTAEHCLAVVHARKPITATLSAGGSSAQLSAMLSSDAIISCRLSWATPSPGRIVLRELR